MNRQSGYYWVKVRRKFGGTPSISDILPAWIIREWHLNDDFEKEMSDEAGHWQDGAENLYNDSDILEINENRIPMPDENKDPYKERVEKDISVLNSLENGDFVGIKNDGSLVKVDIDSYVLKDIKNWSASIPAQIPAAMFDMLPDNFKEFYRPLLLP